MRLLSLKELATAPPRAWLVPGLVPLDGLVCLYGAPGTGKTFVALDLALTLAGGVGQWQGVPLPPRSEPHGVVYVAAEGVGGLPARVRAWMDHTSRATGQTCCCKDDDVPIWFIGQAVDLTREQAVLDFAQAVVERRAERPACPISLVVIDTLARCAAGADENSAQEMGVVVQNLDLLRRILNGCTVMLVHHSTRSAPNAMRGSSAVHGAVETAIALLKDRRAGGSDQPQGLLVSTTKQKDAPPACVRVQLLPHAESLVVAPLGDATDDDAAMAQHEEKAKRKRSQTA